MSDKVYSYKGKTYPAYLKNGNAMSHIWPAAKWFCTGQGLDIGAAEWPFPGATPIDVKENGEFHAMSLPDGFYDYVFSSHCLEHLPDYVDALIYWREKIKPGGWLFLYLPHPDMEYWRPQNCRKHVHLFWPIDVEKLLHDLEFRNVVRSERDAYWSFFIAGQVPMDGNWRFEISNDSGSSK